MAGEPAAPGEPGASGQPGAPGEAAAHGEPRAPFRVAGADLVRQAAADLAGGTDRGIIAARFHNGVTRLIEEACILIREREGLGTVALSGGVFQNLTLLRQAVTRLEGRGFRVLVHSRVPCNDGGISLGQAMVAAARDRSAEPDL
jgi:hydrogenase maturation protein HypF